MGAGMLQEMVGGMGQEMGEELHEEMGMGCTTIFFLRSR
jgi:hypothetical protein